MDSRLRLMAVHAHPDDESSKGAATMAKYVAEGVDVMVVTCTGGERGSVLNPKLDRPDVWRELPARRRREMAVARQLLGVRHAWLGFVDSGLPEGDPLPPLPAGCFARQDVAVAAGRLVGQIRAFRPHVILTYDEEGGYPHPDHIMTHRISVEAFDAAADPARYPAAGAPWRALKLFYHVETRAQILAYHGAMLAEGLASPFAGSLDALLAAPAKDGRVTTRVPCPDFFAVRDAALRAHATQIDPDGEWFSVPLAIRQRVWPTEDYQLVRSAVGWDLASGCLFAGVGVGGA